MTINMDMINPLDHHQHRLSVRVNIVQEASQGPQRQRNEKQKRAILGPARPFVCRDSEMSYKKTAPFLFGILRISLCMCLTLRSLDFAVREPATRLISFRGLRFPATHHSCWERQRAAPHPT